MTPDVGFRKFSLAESEQLSNLIIRHFQRRNKLFIISSGVAIALPDAIKLVAFSDNNLALAEYNCHQT